jgi:hypothetical protein
VPPPVVPAPKAQQGGTRGTPTSWKKVLRAEMRRLGHKRVKTMHNSRLLRKHLQDVCEAKGAKPPNDRKALYQEIRAFLKT